MADSPSPKTTRRGKKSPATAPPQLTAPADRTTAAFCVGLVLLVLAFYSPVIANDFVQFDDNLYITNNAHVQAGLTWPTVEWAFTTFEGSNWHPLTWLSHELDCELFGLNPVAHHAVNVLLHAANAVLLFLLLQNATGSRWRSLFVAALFALHPINVESVAWAAERKNVLSMLFFLLALYAYNGYARAPRARRYAVVAGLYTLALMAKPQVITFPFLLLLWDYWPLGRMRLDRMKFSGQLEAVQGETTATSRSLRDLVVEKIPLFVLSAASAVLTMQVQQSGGSVKALTRFPLSSRLETALISYVRYLGKAIWPTNLAAMYPHPTRLYPAWEVAAAILLLLAISGLVMAARSRRYLVVGWLWFLGSLVPMIGLVQVGEQALADRYAYISFLGLFFMLVWVIADWTAERQIPERRVAIFGAACILLMGILTCRQVRYWHDTESFWRRTIAVTDDNFVAHVYLAGFLRDHGRTDEAMQHYQTALAIRPDDLTANLAIADYERSKGDLAAAVRRYQTLVQTSPNVSVRTHIYVTMGAIYRQMGQMKKARESLESSLQLAPNQPKLLVQVGLIAEKEGDLEAAVGDYSRAMQLQPTDVGYLLLAHALQQSGRIDQASVAMQRAARLSQNLTQAQQRAESLLAGAEGPTTASTEP